MKSKKLLFLLLLNFFLQPHPLYALVGDVLIQDDFKTIHKIDLGATDANVDIVAGAVTLPLSPRGNALTLYEGSYDISLINGSQVETYALKAAAWEKETAFSIHTGLTNPIGLSAKSKTEIVVLDQGNHKAAYYQFDGVGMTENPFLSVLGLNQPVAIALKESGGEILVGQKEAADPSADWYSFDGGGRVLNSALSLTFDPACNPVSLAMNQTSLSYVVADRNQKQVVYYGFDGSSIAANPFMSITAPGLLVNPQSVSLSKDGSFYAVADGDAIKTFQFDGTSMQYNPHLSVSGLSRPVAVALKPGSYDYAVMHHNAAGKPMVSYYAFDGASMQRIDSLSLDNLNGIPYVSPAKLTSKTMRVAEPVPCLVLEVITNEPEDTNILWEATVDGGTTWQVAIPAQPILFTTPGQQIQYRATLSTTDQWATPVIRQVILKQVTRGIIRLSVTSIVGPEIPSNPGRPIHMPPYNNCRIWAGYGVDLELLTIGQVDRILAEITGAAAPILLRSVDGSLTNHGAGAIGYWRGSFATPALTPSGTELSLKASSNNGIDWIEMQWLNFATIEGSALKFYPVHLTR